MSSTCRASDNGGSGLEVLNHSDDVLFLTPNQDHGEDNYEVNINGKNGNDESVQENQETMRQMYTNQAQISLQAETDDLLNEDINGGETQKTSENLEEDSKITEITYVSNDRTSKDAADELSRSYESDNPTKNDEDLSYNTSANNQDTSTAFLNYSNEQLDSSNGQILNTSNNTNNNENSSKIDENVLSEMKYLYKNTRYFLIKSNNYENVNLAKEKSVWSTPRVNEIKLNKAYRECANVILIFSVSESGRFQGYARLSSECSREDDLQVNWILPPNLSARALGGVFKIDWITKNDLFFTKCPHILNPWNENKQVKVGRDGQEYEPHAGELLCRQFDFNPHHEQMNLSLSIDITNHVNSIVTKSKKRHEEMVNEKERYSSNNEKRHSERGRRSRDRSSKSSDREISSDDRRDSQEKSLGHRDTKSSDNQNSEPVRVPYHNNNYNSNYHNRGDYRSNYHNQQNSFSQKRNYYDGNNKRTFYDRQGSSMRGNLNQQNFQQHNNYPNNYQQTPNQQYMHRNMNPHHFQGQQQQQGFYPQMHPHGGNNQMHMQQQNMNQYQQMQMQQQQQYQPPINNIQQQNYQMYQQQQAVPHQNNIDYSLGKNLRNHDSSPKKQRLSNDFAPGSKDLIIKSQTYEEYLAAAAASSMYPTKDSTNPDQQSVFNRIREPTDITQYVNYEALNYQKANYDQSNPSGAYTAPSAPSSKYEQDVEEFLRKTACIPAQASQQVQQSRHKDESSHSEKSRSSHSSSHHHDKKSSSRDKDRDRHHHSHRNRDHRHGSSSGQEKSTRRKSRDRR